MTQPANAVQFDKYPPLRVLLGELPMPGVEYAYVLTQNIGQAQREGYRLLAGVPMFEVRGAELVVLWRGEPLRAIPAESYRARLVVDTGADEIMQLEENTDGTGVVESQEEPAAQAPRGQGRRVAGDAQP